MLLRRSPFGEWLVVYYLPSEIDEKKILSLVRDGGCPRSDIIRGTEESVSMNPILAAGGILQLKVVLDADGTLKIRKIPKGWKFVKEPSHLKKGTHYLSVRIPKNARAKTGKIILENGSGDKIQFHAEIVGKIPG